MQQYWALDWVLYSQFLSFFYFINGEHQKRNIWFWRRKHQIYCPGFERKCHFERSFFEFESYFIIISCFWRKTQKVDCNIGEKGAKTIFESLENNAHLNNVYIGKRLMFILKYYFERALFWKIKDYDTIGKEAVEIICHFLKTNSTIKELTLSQESLLFFFKVNSLLMFIKIGRCKIDDCGAKCIANSLKTNQSLQKLSLC